MERIIGRISQKEQLEDLYYSDNAEFAVVYGRRRVGKSYLVTEYFDNKFAFRHTGLSNVEMEDENILSQQLKAFGMSLRKYGSRERRAPKDWIEAFAWLEDLLEATDRGERQVVFLDEMPWMDTPRSGFITAFEHFWNGWGSSRHNLLLIVCGSATSWLSDKLINNHGGLYNRVTREIYLEPFTLKECEDYYQSRGISMDRKHQIEAYMVFGGIPFYLSLMNKRLSLAQNIDILLFNRKGQLRDEFNRLFDSLFINPDDYKKVVRFLAKKKEGFLRKEIAEGTSIPYGGGLTAILKTLEISNFISAYTNFNASSRQTYYKLSDNFLIFYITFVEDKNNGENFWTSYSLSPRLNTWRGLAFERVCFAHIKNIKQKLGISGVDTICAPWRNANAQIDMLISRADGVINLCEIKYYDTEYEITKDDDQSLHNKIANFMELLNKNQSLHLTIIASNGLKRNMYSNMVQSVVVGDDLF